VTHGESQFVTKDFLDAVAASVKASDIRMLTCMDCGARFYWGVDAHPPFRTPGTLLFASWKDVREEIHCTDHERGVNNQ
jgi:hypothetical protein